MGSIARFASEHTEIMDLHLVSDPCGAIVQLLFIYGSYLIFQGTGADLVV